MVVLERHARQPLVRGLDELEAEPPAAEGRDEQPPTTIGLIHQPVANPATESDKIIGLVGPTTRS